VKIQIGRKVVSYYQRCAGGGEWCHFYTVQLSSQCHPVLDLARFIQQHPSTNLKGLSHEIFGPVFWAVWMYLDLNVNRLWFLNFNDAPLILDNYFKF
jgi:hypothetical protein